VTLSYRKPEFARPKPENVERLEKLRADPLADVAIETPTSERVTTAVGGFMAASRRAGSIRLMLGSAVQRIDADAATIVDSAKQEVRLPNDVVFTMIGREAPLDFFRKSGVRIRGEWTARSYVSLALILLAAVFVYSWKKGGVYFGIQELFQRKGWFPFAVPDWWASLGGAFADKHTLLGTLKITLGEPGFYYSLAYCVCVALFGWKRIRRRKTPYVKVQTLTLAAIQIVPLFLLPYVVLPWLGNNGWFDGGALGGFADAFFPRADYGHGREYWRAFGFVLAWPLFFWNVFTDQPMWAWLAVSCVQTFVIVPLIVLKWGKGAYCGWICSCGALAETLGDAQRGKMPHGRWPNRLNMIGQVFLGLAFFLLVTRSLAWAFPARGSAARSSSSSSRCRSSTTSGSSTCSGPASSASALLALLGPRLVPLRLPARGADARLRALLALPHLRREEEVHLVQRVHERVPPGIDIMNFANKGLPMEDPECVRCSACVQMCPTGVLEFGEIDRATGAELRRDRLVASTVRASERAH
jgi:ferredoxin